MADNQAHADRVWDRLGKRGWILTLKGPEKLTSKPYSCIAVQAGTLVKAEGTTRIEAILRCARHAEEGDGADAANPESKESST